MTKTHAEFLEELKSYCNKESKKKEPCYMCNSRSNYYEDVVEKIEQFQTEQKQVSDEQRD